MGKEVMLDFYAFNIDFAKSAVNYNVMGPNDSKVASGTITKWAPLVMHNMQKGEYKVSIELTGDGADPSNNTTRAIKVDPDAPMDPSMGMSATDPAVNAPPASSADAKAKSPAAAPKSSGSAMAK
ncbi:MAG: hypothetical protein NVS3B20_17630 [Polyangiales bacterium]